MVRNSNTDPEVFQRENHRLISFRTESTVLPVNRVNLRAVG